MCTVTFSPRGMGYCLAMNRDEKRTRAVALPPTRRMVNGRTVVGPTEPGGGTWIALNDRGATLALINWYSVPQDAEKDALSRGEIVTRTSHADSPGAAHAALTELPLNRIRPFRLIGVFPRSRDLVEWRWDRDQLDRRQVPWEIRQWVSSSHDESAAQRIRGETFRDALDQPSAGSVAWLRRLHRSHTPEHGPFSTCMHRPDAATVSYAEITVAARTATMHYHPGPPCERSPGFHESLSIESTRPYLVRE